MYSAAAAVMCFDVVLSFSHCSVRRRQKTYMTAHNTITKVWAKSPWEQGQRPPLGKSWWEDRDRPTAYDGLTMQYKCTVCVANYCNACVMNKPKHPFTRTVTDRVTMRDCWNTQISNQRMSPAVRPVGLILTFRGRGRFITTNPPLPTPLDTETDTVNQ